MITGTVKDPNGAVVPDAAISARNESSGQIRTAVTDREGRFKLDRLEPGNYLISVLRDGFKASERSVVVDDSGKPLVIEFKLEIAETRAEVSIGAKGSLASNSDANYRALREAEPAESFEVSDLVLKRDVGTLRFRSGRVSFLPPVLGKVAVAVFTGDGEFTLNPLIDIEKRYLRMITEKEAVSEQFDRLVLAFSDQTYQEVKQDRQSAAADPGAKEVLREFRNRMRRNTDEPRGFVQSLFSGEGVENLEAMLLAYLYNPKRQPTFNAYIFGRKHNDLRFQVRPSGGLPQLLSPEEVALINNDPQGKEDGIWYLTHRMEEWNYGTASSNEDKRLIDANHYRIETVISGEKLTSTCELTFTALVDGERVFRFDLLPTLRVSRVTFDDQEIGFIQEKKNEDSAFYAILPEAVVKNREYKIGIEYQGNKVLEDAGGGNFAVGARTSWYPSVNAFNDRATFDLTFKVPDKYLLVGVGKKVKEGKEANFAVSQWVSEVPLAVAGFNYGRFKKKEVADEQAKFRIEGYATSDLPNYLRGAEEIGGMSPARLTESAMVDAQNSIRIYNRWFGETPYGRIAITQQPQSNFGQSWPTLVYLPIIAFFDATQRFQLFGGNRKGINDFVQEVTPHEVAHQWWGHVVGWASYHDQWLSEGFADFSASLFLQYTEGGKLDKYLKFWETQRQKILEKNEFGLRPNDAGPLWLGLRLLTYKTGGAYSRLVYPKGSYILHMLRWMMYDRETGDQKFIAMMQDFVKSHYNQNATSESFKAIVEKHMRPGMDLDGNRTMNWFFAQFVYGTEIPSYRLDYTLTPESDGKVLLKGAVTQSGVSPNFKMIVPIYLDFDGKALRLGDIAVAGSTTSKEFQVKLPQRPKRVMINYHYDVLAAESVSSGK